jgi:nitrate/nitrite-specific signal transduction histidine kinase
LQATDWENGVVTAAAAMLAAPFVGAASAFHANAPTESTAAAAINVSTSLRMRSSLFNDSSL